ncbi:MAG TPA: hypothetical protein VMZ50_06760 [Phycisphaerae bacterium]|nr:hypothetical protein [Phycisphaerae bacterium]
MKRMLLGLCVPVLVCPLFGAPPEKSEKARKKGAPASVAEAMQRKIDRPVIAGTLVEALKQCEKLATVRFLVDWEGIEATGVRRDAKVSVTPVKATVQQLLDLVLLRVAAKGKPLGWYALDKTVFVTTQMRALHLKRIRPRQTVARREQRRTPPPARPGRIRGMEFNKTPVSEVIAFLRAVSGLNIHVNWRSLAQVNIDEETPVTLKVKDVSLKKALDLVVDHLSADRDKLERVYWVVEENVITMATGTAMNTTLKTKVLDVADLLVVTRDFRGPKVNLEGSAGRDSDGSGTGGAAEGLFKDLEEDSVDKDDSGDAKERMRKGLIEALKDSIGPEMWFPEGKGSIRLHGNQLIISQTALGFKLLQETSLHR